ncbi:MAG: HlyC/CorC family transporter [Lachnospiraceae bacterium]|nr:HlyC/CorC family transporter [Lachnospiraceae bacterium]
MDPEHICKLCILLLFLILSAFFSSAETAFTTVKRVRMQILADEGDKRALLVLKLLEKLSKTLSTILIGNNVVNIGASALCAVLAGELFGNMAVGLATGILTLLVLLFGEITPKTLALRKNERYALRYAPAIYALSVILTPVIFIVDKLSNGILRLLGVDPHEKVLRITESELLGLVDAGHEEGVIESEEREMIHNMFEFSDALARDIMIPRVNMIMADIHADYDEIRDLFKEHLYSRLPVYEDSPDNIVGVLNIKDFLFIEDPSRFHMQALLREPYYTYEYKKVADLLNEMRQKNRQVSIVLNEYGTAEGMITMEDLLEEIIGQIRDEYDEDEAELIKKLSDNEYLVDATMNLDDINEALETSYESEAYDSISGLIIELLDDRLPEEGESVELPDGSVARVEKLEGNRIETVRLTLPKKEADQ